MAPTPLRRTTIAGLSAVLAGMLAPGGIARAAEPSFQAPDLALAGSAAPRAAAQEPPASDPETTPATTAAPTTEPAEPERPAPPASDPTTTVTTAAPTTATADTTPPPTTSAPATPPPSWSPPAPTAPTTAPSTAAPTTPTTAPWTAAPTTPPTAPWTADPTTPPTVPSTPPLSDPTTEPSTAAPNDPSATVPEGDGSRYPEGSAPPTIPLEPVSTDPAETDPSAAGVPSAGDFTVPPGDPAALPSLGPITAGVPVNVVLDTIRTLESGGRYQVGPNKAGASGAYQYIVSTWAGYAGYAEAYLAPPEVQDARAQADVERILTTYGDVSMVPVLWYFPLAVRDPTWMDRVPNPAGGNKLTVREYQTKWLALYAQKLATYAPDPTLPPSQPGDTRSIAFPVLGPVSYSNDWGACRDGCSRHHQGNDLLGVRMQPLLAATDGVVSRIRYENAGNAGAIITLTDADGWSYNYFHVNNDTPGSDDGGAGPQWQISPYITVGTRVEAGRIIGYMGDSGNSEHSVPHLHFEVRRPDGTPVNPYPSLQAAQQRQLCTIGIGPWATMVTEGADPLAPSVSISPLFGTGSWSIDAVGRVTATGDAALIRPGTATVCAPGPDTPFGTGAGGANVVPPGGFPSLGAGYELFPSVDQAPPTIIEFVDSQGGLVLVLMELPSATGMAQGPDVASTQGEFGLPTT